jgi:hypothetical protein
MSVLSENGAVRGYRDSSTVLPIASFAAPSLRMTAGCIGIWLLAACMSTAVFAQGNSPASGSAASKDANDGRGLLIEPAELPQTYPRSQYEVRLQGRGDYVPTLHWRLQSGNLPPGVRLEEGGLLHGSPERAGEFQFVVVVKDGSQPQQIVQKAFTIKVVEGLVVAWKTPAHVSGNRIDGSVEVSNLTAEDMDLTFDVKAVAENGRATEIGYQHFPLKHGTQGMALPFGDTLPYGGYTVYVNVVGEILSRNVIYRQQMQTPHALQVLVGP